MNQLERLLRDPCPFTLGQRVKVRLTVPNASEWRGVFLITGLRWEYQKEGLINVEIALEDDIKLGLGAVDGFSVYDLEPV